MRGTTIAGRQRGGSEGGLGLGGGGGEKAERAEQQLKDGREMVEARPPRRPGRERSCGGDCPDDGEGDGEEAASRCARAGRRAHFMPLDRWA